MDPANIRVKIISQTAATVSILDASISTKMRTTVVHVITHAIYLKIKFAEKVNALQLNVSENA